MSQRSVLHSTRTLATPIHREVGCSEIAVALESRAVHLTCYPDNSEYPRHVEHHWPCISKEEGADIGGVGWSLPAVIRIAVTYEACSAFRPGELGTLALGSDLLPKKDPLVGC